MPPECAHSSALVKPPGAEQPRLTSLRTVFTLSLLMVLAEAGGPG
jgi:hypothetical protein